MKRYLEEEGTDIVDALFESCWSGRNSLSTSVWNVGECIGALDRRRLRREVTEDEFQAALGKFVAETIALLEVGRLSIAPVTGEVLGKAWPIVLSDHLYEADALQLTTHTEERCDAFITADSRLTRAARRLNIDTFNPESKDDSEVLRGQLMQS